MLSGNSTNSAGASVRGEPRELEQAAYDELDWRLRWFVREFPEKLSSTWVLEQQRMYGPDNVLKRGLVVTKERYPTFRWPNGAPW